MKQNNAYLDSNGLSFIIKNTPLVAIDLIIQNNDKNILVGLRRNEPAKNYWFVPGGRIYKNERIKDAFERIALSELGVELIFDQAKFIGVFEHLYETNFLELPGFGTHYVVLAYQVILESDLENIPKEQHKEFRWISRKDFSEIEVHPNTKAYF